MMDYETQLKLQAHLDRELSGEEARQVQERLATDPEAQALLAELKSTSGALAGVDVEGEVKLPESREFFWSKIHREIQRRQPPTPQPSSIFAGWLRWLVPAGATAAAMAAVLLIGLPEQGPESETSLTDSSAFTYHDYAARTTLVWLSYPAEDDLLEDDAVDWMD